MIFISRNNCVYLHIIIKQTNKMELQMTKAQIERLQTLEEQAINGKMTAEEFYELQQLSGTYIAMKLLSK